jgi:hypothetical protein
MPTLSALQAAMGGEDFEVVTIATGRNDPVGMAQFFAETGVDNLPLHRDPQQRLAREMGVLGLPITVILNPDGMEIEGGAKLQGATLTSFGDHRIAMAFLVAGMFAEGTTTLEGSECIATSYPGFERHLDLFLNGDTGDRPIPVMSDIPQQLAAKLSQKAP